MDERRAAYTSDLFGASSWLWRFQHNTLHHANANVVGFDADIGWLRSPPRAAAALAAWYRDQHVYMWPLYGFLALKSLLVSDVVALDQGPVRTERLPSASATPIALRGGRRQGRPSLVGVGAPAAVAPMVGRARVLPGVLLARRVRPRR